MLVAAIMTWVGSALMVFGGIGMLALGGSQDLLDEAGLGGMGGNLQLVGGVSLVISIAAIILAVGAFKRNKGAMFALVGVGALYVIFSIVSMFMGMSSGWLAIVWVAVACALLLRSRTWYESA